MNYSLYTLTPSDTRLLEFVRGVYIDSFPADERRNFDLVIKLLDESDKFSIDILKRDDTPIGFITYWIFQDFAYVEHFAIDQSNRGGGAGSNAIKLLLDKIDLPVVLEVEKPETEDAVRRIRFYEKHNFKIWHDVEYIQPAYSPELNSIELKLMTAGELDLVIEAERVISTLHSHVYNVK